MRSLAIWKRRKRPMTTPARHTKSKGRGRQGHLARDNETRRDDKTLQLSAAGRNGTARQLARDRQIRSIELHQAGEHEQRQASRYDRRQAREHGRCSAERNRTSRNRRRRPRNNRHSHTPPQELKIAASGYCLRQSTSPETKRGPFPQPRETGLFNCKNSSNSTAAS